MSIKNDRKKLIDQIIKLNALYNDKGATEAERETAKAFVEKLMAKHEITFEEVEGSETEFEKIEFDTEKRSVDKYREMLMKAICDFNGVYVTLRRANSGWLKEHPLGRHFFNLYGRKSDVENSIYMYRIFERQMKDGENLASKKVKKLRGYGFNYRDCNGYRLGFVNGVYQRFNEMEKVCQKVREEKGLVPVSSSKQLLDKIYKNVVSKLDIRMIRARNSAISHDAYVKGKTDGKNVSMNKGVNYTTKTKLIAN